MKLVAINGSGRVDGNTAVLVKAVLDGAAEAGCQTHMLQLGAMTIAGCNACRQCKQTRRCTIADDMEQFYRVAPAADVLMLASPIYLDHVTAQTMAFIQRLFCYLGPPPALESRWPNPNTRAVVAITYGAGDPNQYDGVLEWMAGRMKFYFDIDTAATFKIPSTQHDPVIGRDHREVQQAYEFGKTLGDARNPRG